MSCLSIQRYTRAWFYRMFRWKPSREFCAYYYFCSSKKNKFFVEKYDDNKGFSTCLNSHNFSLSLTWENVTLRRSVWWLWKEPLNDNIQEETMRCFFTVPLPRSHRASCFSFPQLSLIGFFAAAAKCVRVDVGVTITNPPERERWPRHPVAAIGGPPIFQSWSCSGICCWSASVSAPCCFHCIWFGVHEKNEFVVAYSPLFIRIRNCAAKDNFGRGKHSPCTLQPAAV